ETHTKYSDGLTEPAEMVKVASESKLEAIAITDHGPEIFVGILPGDIDSMLSEVGIIKRDAEIPVFLGVEANIVNQNGDIDISNDVLSELDIVLGGVHDLTYSARDSGVIAENYYESIMNAIERQEIDVLAHPFWLHEDLSPYLSQDDLKSFAKLAVETDTAIELNAKYEVPSIRVIKTCLREGVKLSFGTDAHIPEEVGNLNWQKKVMKDLGASEDNLILERFI
ncbi:MAG: PHP domain-containing protein, partial [Hadesarchaea archaeon]|nr:PHP domain-containing protein [Hadesarchaea archaeon]